MKMFQPSICLSPDFNAEYYSMYATVPVPSGCYVAAAAIPELPPGVQLAVPAQPMQLVIKKHELCFQKVPELDYWYSGLQVQKGVDQFIAFSVLDGEVLGVASVPIPQFDPEALTKLTRPGPAEASGAVLQSVSGWIDAMPGSAPDMHVIITMWAPTDGYTYEVKDAGPFGFTGRTLLLELTANAPQAGPDIVTVTEIRFDRELKDKCEFDSVAVLFEGRFMFDALQVVE